MNFQLAFQKKCEFILFQTRIPHMYNFKISLYLYIYIYVYEHNLYFSITEIFIMANAN
jgi:hypothetical protein